MGQFINMLKVFSYQTPEGAVLTAERMLRDAAEKHLGSYRKLIDAARRALAQAHRVAVTDTVNSPDVQTAARGAVDEAIEKDAEVHRGIVLELAEPFAGSEVILEHAREAVRAKVNQLLNVQPRPPGMTVSQHQRVMMNDLAARAASIANGHYQGAEPGVTLKEKLKQRLGISEGHALKLARQLDGEFAKMVEKAKGKLKARIAAQRARLQQKAADLEGASETELDRRIRGKLREWNKKLGEALKASEMGGKLGDAIVEAAGLQGEAATRMREKINQRFDAMGRERKRKALEKLQGQSDDKKVRSLKQVWQKMIEMNDLGALEDAKYFDAIKERLGLKRLLPAEAAQLRALAQAFQNIPEMQTFRRQEAAIKLFNAIERLKGINWWEWPMAIWYAHILSGPNTHLVNAISNAINLAGALTAQTVRHLPSLPATLNAVYRGALKGLPEAWAALREGAVTGPRIGNKFQDPGVWQKVDSKWVLPWALVGRALAAADLLFFHPASEARQALLARNVAKREGRYGAALRNRVDEILGNTEQFRSEAALQATREGFTGYKHSRRVNEILQQRREQFGEFSETGREYALRTTFNNEPYGVMGLLANAVNGINNKLIVTRFLVPFTNIIANVTNESLMWTPIGSLRALLAPKFGLYGKDYDVTSWADREQIADMHAKAAIGTLLLVALAIKAASDLDDDEPEFAITGQGPKDKSKRDTLREAGWKPNSVKVGDRYYSYLQTPAAVPLAIVGNVMDGLRYGHLSEGSALDKAGYTMAMTAKTMVQQSFLDSMARLFGAIEHPSDRNVGDNMADWAGRTGSSFVVPNAVRQLERVFYDDKVYDGFTDQGEMLKHLPFVRQNLKPVLNGLGEPIRRPLSDRFTSELNPDPVWRELARLNVGVYPRSLEWKGQTLSDEQVYEVVRRSGPEIRRRIEKVMASQTWGKMNDKPRKDRIEYIIREQRTRAKMNVIRGL